MIIILILVALLIFLLFVQCNGIRYYTFGFESKKPCTVILSATHGNEPAGFFALHRIIDSKPIIKQGKVFIIPSVNPCGLMANQRHNPLGDYDINRGYPNKTYLNSQIKKFIDQADWVIDLHEGYGFHKLDRRSVGSGVYPGNTKEAQDLTNQLITGINTSIKDVNKQFVTFKLPNVKGSLRDYCSNTNKNYILIETSGINDIQPLPVRVSQQQYFVENIINYLHNK
jgi:predicted deacylase